MSLPTLVSNHSWSQVTVTFALVAFNSAISQVLQLDVGASLVIAALRCIAQLIAVTFVLRYVFSVEILLNALGAYEIVIKAERRCQWMFMVVFTTMLVSTIPVSILGARFAMDIDPFRSPEQYLPVMSMLCENAISGISVSLGYVLNELDANRIELPGTLHVANRHLLAVEGLRRGLMPTINRMSLMGATAIPSMMIRTILGGTDVQQAARLQIIITFMMAASTTLSCIVATHFVLWICVDSEQHIRSNCIDTRPHVVRRAFNSVILVIINIMGHIRNLTVSCVEHFTQRGAQIDDTVSPSEHTGLLNGSGS
ncbi:hypothetical protein F5888DRAFT_1634801 [Russula emetica]|nr:hypothetical protein F5888DRAFT_1634801 [Russula emetica]